MTRKEDSRGRRRSRGSLPSPQIPHPRCTRAFPRSPPSALRSLACPLPARLPALPSLPGSPAPRPHLPASSGAAPAPDEGSLAAWTAWGDRPFLPLRRWDALRSRCGPNSVVHSSKDHVSFPSLPFPADHSDLPRRGRSASPGYLRTHTSPTRKNRAMASGRGQAAPVRASGSSGLRALRQTAFRNHRPELLTAPVLGLQCAGAPAARNCPLLQQQSHPSTDSAQPEPGAVLLVLPRSESPRPFPQPRETGP